MERPQSRGFSPESLDAIERTIETAVADGRITAAIAALARDGETTWLTTAGEMEPGVAMREDAIMPLASVGKMFTATAAMILEERGTISLDDPVSEYIPEFANVVVEVTSETGDTKRVPPERAITIRHLLTHTSGLTVTGNEFWDAWGAHTGITTTTHFARALAAMPLVAQPGSEFGYGQTGAAYEVLGAVIEIASGQTLEGFMTESIFEPLGLDDSYFYTPEKKSHRSPAVYRRVDGELRLDRPAGEDFSRSTFFHGGGGVRSTAADVLRFARLFLEGGSVDGVRILGVASVEAMMSDQLGERAPQSWRERGRSWGFGAAVQYAPDETGTMTLLQYGWVGGGFATVWVDRKERLVAYFNFPLTPPGDNELLGEFQQRVYAALVNPQDEPG